ncbi:hypothetical protein B0H14DRAFT_3477115 [Mycena olivaceomarginata]|nr:hypothetical protein B0H14DRAFT_3477115 [Mycena olivaceomarginata]
MAAQSKLTPAEKRKLTIAAKAQKEVEENIVFRNQSQVSGGRQAKKDAKKNAVWKADQPVTRKRTASTAEASGPAKKARETKSGTDSEGIAEDSDEEPPVKSKSKSSARISVLSHASSGGLQSAFPPLLQNQVHCGLLKVHAI